MPGTSNSCSNENFVDKTWNELNSGLQRIFRMEEIKRAEAMTLYSEVFNYCTDTKREFVPPTDAASDKSHTTSVAQFQG